MEVWRSADQSSTGEYGRRETCMPDLPERARAYLEALEADRLAALAVSEQKAEEAKLIKARQEGFREALEIIGEHVPITNIDSPDHSKELGQPHAHRGTRRNIS